MDKCALLLLLSSICWLENEYALGDEEESSLAVLLGFERLIEVYEAYRVEKLVIQSAIIRWVKHDYPELTGCGENFGIRSCENTEDQTMATRIQTPI
jgi:hypothetical protein